MWPLFKFEEFSKELSEVVETRLSSHSGGLRVDILMDVFPCFSQFYMAPYLKARAVPFLCLSVLFLFFLYCCSS